MSDMKALSNEAKSCSKELKKAIKKYEKKESSIQQYLMDDMLFFLCHVGAYNGEFVETGKYSSKRVSYVLERCMKETIDEMDISRAIGRANSDKRNSQGPTIPTMLASIDDMEVAAKCNLITAFCKALYTLAAFAFELDDKKTADTKKFLSDYYKAIEKKFDIDCKRFY